MEAYPAYYENGRIIPIGNPAIPERRKLVITVLDEEVTPSVRSPLGYGRGCMKGKMWMADDFDAPLEDFKEYME